MKSVLSITSILLGLLKRTRHFLRGQFLYSLYEKRRINSSISELIKRLNLQPGAPLIIIDLGAFHGSWTDQIIKLHRNVKAYLFEPSPSSFEYLRNKYANCNNVLIYNRAVSDEEGISDLILYRDQYTASLNLFSDSMANGWSGDVSTSFVKHKIVCITIDQFLAQFELDLVHILKIDVQGNELNVLNGGISALCDGIFGFIVMEIIVWPTYQNQALPHQVMSILENNNYILYTIYDRVFATTNGPLLQYDVIYAHKSLVLR